MRRPKPPSAPVLIVAEPPVDFVAEPPMVVDCNMVGAMLFQEAERAEATARLCGRELHAPTLLEYELVSVALKKLRHGRSDVAQAAMARYPAMPIVLHAVDLSGVLALAEHYGLSGYDAAYLWLAAELKASLATFDRKLGEAAQRHLGGCEEIVASGKGC